MWGIGGKRWRTFPRTNWKAMNRGIQFHIESHSSLPLLRDRLKALHLDFATLLYPLKSSPFSELYWVTKYNIVFVDSSSVYENFFCRPNLCALFKLFLYHVQLCSKSEVIIVFEYMNIPKFFRIWMEYFLSKFISDWMNEQNVLKIILLK